MRYLVIAESCVGMNKGANQDSLLVKHGRYMGKEVLMAVICDGVGGLSHGEIASTMVVDKFSEWFSAALPYELKNVDMNVIGDKVVLLLKALNVEMLEYGLRTSGKMGTTFTGVLFINEQFVLAHVGDTRLYHIGSSIKQISEDHTFVAREIKNGRLTPQEAAKDRRRNMLLQCVGASETIIPQFLQGVAEEGAYLLCTDGFRRKVTESELMNVFAPKSLRNKRTMRRAIQGVITLNRNRSERDDISAILIKSKPSGGSSILTNTFRVNCSIQKHY